MSVSQLLSYYVKMEMVMWLIYSIYGNNRAQNVIWIACVQYNSSDNMQILAWIDNFKTTIDNCSIILSVVSSKYGKEHKI